MHEREEHRLRAEKAKYTPQIYLPKYTPIYLPNISSMNSQYENAGKSVIMYTSQAGAGHFPQNMEVHHKGGRKYTS